MSEVDRVLIDASIAMVKALSKISDLEAEIARLRAPVDPPERVSEQFGARWLNVTPPGIYIGPFPTQFAAEAYMEAAERESEASALRDEIEDMRKVFETVFPAVDGFTEAFDALVTAGLLVEVPSDAAYREWWGDEPTMWVWRWHPLATASTPDEPTP